MMEKSHRIGSPSSNCGGSAMRSSDMGLVARGERRIKRQGARAMVTTSEKAKRRARPRLTQGCGPDCILNRRPEVACPCCGCDVSRGISQMLLVVLEGKGQYRYVRRGERSVQFCRKCAQIITGVRDKRGRLLEQYRDTPWLVTPPC